MIREWLRKWLGIESESPRGTETICVLIDGDIRTVVVTGSVGLCLAVSTGRSVRLVSASQAVDTAQFWAVWRRLSPKVCWEDGTQFSPPHC